MKRILIIAISVSCLMLSGCKEKECTGCCDEKYAPAGVTVSWTGYNDVMTFRKYFKCHPETIRQHAEAQDTIKVMGYIYYGDPDAEEMCWSEYGFLNGSALIRATCRKDLIQVMHQKALIQAICRAEIRINQAVMRRVPRRKQ